MLEEKREPSSDSLLAANIPKAPSGSGSAPAQLHFLILTAQGRDGRADIRLWVADPQTRSGGGRPGTGSHTTGEGGKGLETLHHGKCGFSSNTWDAGCRE